MPIPPVERRPAFVRGTEDWYRDVPLVGGDGNMKRQLAAGLSLAVLCLAVLGFAAFSFAYRPAAAPSTDAAVVAVSSPSAGRQVYSSIKELMESVVDPSADVLWGSVGTIVDREKGIQELSPKTPEEWRDVRRAAVRIIEGGNLLMMPGREAAPAGSKSETPGVELEPAEITVLIKRDRKSFDAFARDLQGLGVEALRASDSKNVDLLMDIGARMDTVCESCHQTFWYPNVIAPRSTGRSPRP